MPPAAPRANGFARRGAPAGWRKRGLALSAARGPRILPATMRVTCPACTASYEVPDRMIGPEGRRLRCAKCGEQWTARREGAPAGPEAALPPAPQAAAPATPFPAPPAPEPAEAMAGGAAVSPPHHPAPRRPPRVIEPPLPALGDAAPPRGGRLALAFAWVATGLFVLALGAGLALFRGEIVEAWPPAARLYQAIGVADGA